ncbi:sugar phosphate nucleotidyltransferase [Legionella sp. CNM-4043-24]|uniref:sugar phosphate nucleotidyltransferase n=1 Tax=Legionella sp. CNM-4043-24 TaxID=3421646 RepID=UPI00403B234E
MTLAILAGGYATRLGPFTRHRPKSMLEVAGRPFIEWQLTFAKEQGFERVVLCLGHLGEQIQSFVGDGARYGLNIDYSSDGVSPQGTGGALKKALPLLGDAFFVLYGDSWLSVSCAELENRFRAQSKPALMTIIKREPYSSDNNVRFEDGVLLEYNKHQASAVRHYIDYGISILSASMLADYPDHEGFDLADVYHDYSCRGEILGYEVFHRFYDIGTPEAWCETDHYLRGVIRDRHGKEQQR